MGAIEFAPVWLSIRLAGLTTLILIVTATPLAWWLAYTRSRWRAPCESIVALPLVLPPTVLGFYLLMLMSPDALPGRLWVQVTGDTLAFSFSGLVVASVFYSLPFAVQPLQGAFANVGSDMLEAAAMSGASPWQQFRRIVLPLSAPGYLSAAILSFAHTLGEFGVVLMVGGNIPQQTRTISIAIYEHVETVSYREAHLLAGGLLLFSFLVLLLVFLGKQRRAFRGLGA